MSNVSTWCLPRALSCLWAFWWPPSACKVENFLLQYLQGKVFNSSGKGCWGQPSSLDSLLLRYLRISSTPVSLRPTTPQGTFSMHIAASSVLLLVEGLSDVTETSEASNRYDGSTVSIGEVRERGLLLRLKQETLFWWWFFESMIEERIKVHFIVQLLHGRL